MSVRISGGRGGVGGDARAPGMVSAVSLAMLLLVLVPLSGQAGVPSTTRPLELVPGPEGLSRGVLLSNGNMLSVIGGGTPGLLGGIGFDSRGNFVVNPTALGDRFSPFSFTVANPNSRNPTTGSAALVSDHRITAGSLENPGAIGRDQANALIGQPIVVRDAAGQQVFSGAVAANPAVPPGGAPRGLAGGRGGAPPAGGDPAGGGGGAPPAGGGPAGGGGGLVPCLGGPCILDQLVTLGRNIFDLLLGIGAIAAVAAIVGAGFQYITARGDPAALSEAKKKLTYAVIGLLILLLSFVIVKTILDALGFTGGQATLRADPTRRGLPPSLP